MNNNQTISRRQFLKITALAGGAIVAGKMVNDLVSDGFLFMIKETRALMGTVINLTVVAESRKAGESAVAATFAELERQVEIFSHRAGLSPAAQLNKNGKLENPPQELVDVLTQAVNIGEMTGWAFDVTVKPLVDLYQKSQPDLPSEDAVEAALHLVNYANVHISESEISFTQPGMAITLDGIAKGSVVDAGVAQLRKLGFDSVFVEAGGDLLASGDKAPDNPWSVGVLSPRQEQGGLVTSFKVSNQAVATSGDYMQYFSNDMHYHHILDPRSGYSAPYLASVTVIAPSCALADALATALMVMVPEDGLALVESLDSIDALLIGKDLQEYRSFHFKDR